MKICSPSPDSTAVLTSDEVDDDDDIDDDVSLKTAGQSFATESFTTFLSSKVIDSQKQMLNVSRGNLLRQCFRMLKSKQFVLRMAPDVSFIGEDGIDAEGLTREFLTSVNTAIREGERPITLFEGEFPHLVPVHSTDLLTSKMFFYAGQLLSYCIAHGGIGFVGLSPVVASYLVHGCIDGACDLIEIRDIADCTLREMIGSVSSSFHPK